MDYLFSALFLALNLFQYEVKMNKYLFLVLGAAVFIALFKFTFDRTKNFLTSCLIMMCYTWQSSWINIFGEPTSELQLPWYYIIGVIMVIYTLINVRHCFERKFDGFAMAVFVAQLIWMNYPMIISETFSEGFKNYIMIAFFSVLVFICFLFHDEASEQNYNQYRNALIWSVFLASLGLILQYTMYKAAGISLFKIEIIPSFSGYQLGCQLLMEDHSSATIMFGVGAFYVMTKLDGKNWPYLASTLVVIIAAMAMTSRRTSTLTLVAMFALFAIVNVRGLGKKIGFTALVILLGGVMLFFLLKTRPVDSLAQLLNDNGRFLNFNDAANTIKAHPFGVGLDDYALALNYMPESGIVPHNTFLRWLCIGGWPLGILMALAIGYCAVTALKKGLKGAFWGILYTVLASNFIPDIMCARFFVIICSAAMLMPKYKKPEVTLKKPKKLKKKFTGNAALRGES